MWRSQSPALQRSTTFLQSSEQQSGDVLIESEQSRQQRWTGIAVLLTVPLTWGTYNPVVKYLYTLRPPVPGLVFSAAYYVLAAVTLWAILAMMSTSSGEEDVAGNSASVWGGIELGSYLFLGNLVQVLALKSVPADRAGFLVQLTTILVPFLEAGLTGRSIPGRTWLACWIALAGVVAMQVENLSTTSLVGLNTGDAMILLAATFYSLHVVRLGKFAAQTTPLRLAASKATVEAILSLGLIGVLLGVASTGFGPAVEVQSFLATVRAEGGLQSDSWAQAVAAILWTGWATCAYTIYAQSYGQRRVKPTDANLIYTVQPIFTALFAFALLGETIGLSEIVGGALITSSVYVVASDSDDDNS